MPWTASDAERHTKKADTAAKRKRWAEIANDRLAACLAKGGTEEDCEALAIRQANAVIAGMEESMGGQYEGILSPVSLIVDIDGELVSVASLVEMWIQGGEAAAEKHLQTRQEEAEIEEAVAGSLEDYAWSVRDAFEAAFGRRGPDGYRIGPYARHVFKEDPELGTVVIARAKDGAFFAVPFEETEDGFAFANQDQWEEVVLTYRKKEPVAEVSEVEFSESASGHAVAIAEDNLPASADARAPLLLDMILIEPGWGNAKDKHYYPREILERDAPVFVGAKMYATDHRPEEKSVRTEVGIIKELVGFTDGGAPIGRSAIHDPGFAEATRNRDKLGTLHSLECSILAVGKAKKGEIDGQEANIVESITKANAVDFVTKAGAGGHALAIAESGEGSQKGDAEMLDQDKPQEKEGVIEEASPVEAEDVILSEEGDTKESQEADQPLECLSESDVRAILDETNLPETARGRLLKEQYPDEQALRDAIASEVTYIKAITGSGRPFAGATQQTVQVTETNEEREARRTARFNEHMRAIGAREV